MGILNNNFNSMALYEQRRLKGNKMIKKLSEYKITSRDGSFINVECNTKIINTLVQKINELVDAVNGILAMQEQYATIYNEDIMPMLMPENEEPADPYTEQRRWIGKLCWFWDEDRKDAFCDVLGYVDENSKYPYVNVDCYSGYKHCEPVKPDDDVIYKGGDND